MGPLKSHFESCNVIPDDSMVCVLGKANSLAKLLTLEALFIKEIKSFLNTKDEFSVLIIYVRILTLRI